MKNFKKFLSYYKPYKHIVIFDLFCAILLSLISLVFPMLIRKAAQEAPILSYSKSIDMLIRIAVIAAVLLIAEWLCTMFVTYFGHVSGAKMEYDMRNDIFSHLQKLSFTYYDNEKIGQIMTRITTDLFEVTELAHHGPEDVIISVVRLIGSFVILINVNWILTLCIFAVLPFMFIFASKYRKKMKTTFKNNRARIAEINTRIEDSISGIRVVKSFSNEELELEKFKKGNRKYVDAKRDSYGVMAKFHSGLGAFISFFNVGVVLAGVLLIINGNLRQIDLITFILYIGLLIEPIKKLINFTETFQNGAAGFDRFMEIMNTEPDISDSSEAVNLKEVKGNIEFKNVFFRYTEKNEYVLKNLSFKVKQGEYVAIVGESGVGKTTLCSLMPRFYDVLDGEITLDGKNLKDIKLKSLRQSIGLVQQDVFLFGGNIRDNIGYGKKDSTDEEIEEAAKNANAHDFIMSLPDGYDTDIGPHGVKLSGGQKQRLSIARVFLKDPPVVILDEATSSLDNLSERVVRESFERLSVNRTTFVIAHRLSTIKKAGRIIVLINDGIGEEGTHEELLARNGVYSKLYKSAAFDEFIDS